MPKNEFELASKYCLKKDSIMKKSVIFFNLFMLFTISAHKAESKNVDLPNFYEVNAKLFRGGQPTEKGVNELAKMGVKTIINLRGEDKNSLREKVWAEKANIKFISVNLSNWFEPKTADIEQIIKEIDAAANQPVFVHCKRGADRTGTIIAVYRITHDKYTAKQAIEEAKKFDFGWWQFWMKDYINDYYRDYKSEK
jgi:tyrosine-protein phosphatase SIW14